MSNQNQETKTYFLWQTLRANRNNNGTILQLTPSKLNGGLLITLAPQKGYNSQNLPVFDYQQKVIFGLSEQEIMQVAKLYKQKELGQISFPHLNGNRNGKTIFFETNIYNDKKQLKVFVSQENIKIGIFLNDLEAEVLIKNLVDSTSLYNKMNAVLALRNI